MINPFFRAEWLQKGRNIQLPLMVIFYNAILAFVIILFMVLNEGSFQNGYYYDTSTYQYQFLIISTLQIVAVFFMMPYSVAKTFVTDKENHMLEQFDMIPGVSMQYVTSKIFLAVLINCFIFISGLPAATLSCIYTGIGGAKLLRLGAMVLMFTFWSSAITVFCYIIYERSIWAFSGSLLIHGLFLGGTLFLAEMIRNISLLSGTTGELSTTVSNLCLFLLLLNPLSSYMGYYGNVTGDIGMFSELCSHLGIDTSQKMFIFLFYKAATLMCLLVGVLFIFLSIWYMERRKRG
ncbi:MAG: hypothetical protein LUF92_11015 [Clostridiales bacterium]|nr:hypothetical protein [Clostridiales bacterium]